MPTIPHDPLARNAPLSDAARRALIAAAATYRTSVEALRDAVCAYVSGLQLEGAAPDEIAHAVRTYVADLRARDPAAVPSPASDALLDRLVAECLALASGAP